MNDLEWLGELYPSDYEDNWRLTRYFEVPVLGEAQMEFELEEFEDDPNQIEFAKAVRRFVDVPVSYRNEVAAKIFAYYREIMSRVDHWPDDPGIAEAKDVWKYIQITSARVSRLSDDDPTMYVAVYANCDWDREHGLTLPFREGKTLTVVHGIDGHIE